MIKFDIQDGKLIINPQFLMHQEFIDIWESDKTREKLTAHKLLRYVFHFCDLTVDNPIKDTAFNLKEQEAKFLLYNDRDYKFSEKELELLTPAIECYNKYNVSVDERMLEMFNKKMDQVKMLLDDLDPEIVRNVTSSGEVRFTNNLDIITKALKDFDTVLDSRNKVMAKIKNEAGSNKVRGNLSRSPLSKGKLKIKKKKNG